MTSIPTAADFSAALATHQTKAMAALPGRTNHLPTGVLVPLVWAPDPVCIATVRAATLRQHASEVCFPGGRPDEGDADLAHTALREAQEELGIEGARLLGELSSVPLYTSDYRLMPFVAEVPACELVINPDEVAAVLRWRLAEVLTSTHIDAIPWTHEGARSLSPVFEHGAHVMFGATAHTFYELLVVAAPLFDLEPPPLKSGRFSWGDFIPALREP